MSTFEPGEALDALVAEKVMGWKYSEDSMAWQDPRKDLSCVWDCSVEGEFRPSTDIAAAMKVFEKHASVRQVCIVKSPEGGWYVGNIETSQVIVCEDEILITESAPHAICLAALWAIGEL